MRRKMENKKCHYKLFFFYGTLKNLFFSDMKKRISLDMKNIMYIYCVYAIHKKAQSYLS